MCTIEYSHICVHFMSTVPRQRGAFLNILYNTGWLTIARVSGDLVGVLLFISISRKLGIAEIGEYSFAFAMAALVSAGVGLGLEEYGLREYSRQGLTERRQIFRGIMGLQVGLLPLLALLLAAFLFYSNTSVGTSIVVIIVCVHVLTFQFANMYFIPAFADQKMLMPAVAEFICRVGAICVGTLLVAFAGGNLIVGMAPLAVGTTLLLLVSLTSARHYNGELALSTSLKSLRSVLEKTWPFAVSTIIYNVYNRIGVVMLTTMQGQSETGVYATALKLYEFGTMPLYLLGIAVFPSLSRTYGESREEFCKTADKFLRTALAVAALLAWGLVFVAPNLLGVLLGPEFILARQATQFMAMVSVLGALDIFCLRVMLAMNLQRQRVYVQAVAVGINVALNLLLIPTFGVKGVIISTVVAQLTMVSWYLIYFSREPGMRVIYASLRSFALIVAIVVGSTAILMSLGFSETLIAVMALVALIVAVLSSGFVPAPWQLLRQART